MRRFIKGKSVMRGVVFFVSGIATLFAVMMVFSPTANAYNGAHLIDNHVFLDGEATPNSGARMSISQIQTFLSQRGSGLASRSFHFDCFGGDSQERQWYMSIGAPCDQTVSAATIIYFTGRIYGVNPQAIMATMQKEQSLITTPNPTSWQINNAMGYGCPTTGSCSNPGFFLQLDHGTWALRWHYERARGNQTWWRTSSGWTCGTEKNFYKPNLYPGTATRFYDGNGTHYQTYTIANAATAAMYCYTPHAFNNPNGINNVPQYGHTGQYYSGSYWFVRSFNNWFGSVYANLNFEPLEVPRWMQLNEDTRKRDMRLGVEVDSNLATGRQFYFDTKVQVNGVWYLRTQYDTVHKLQKGIPLSALTEAELEFVSLDVPREMRTKQSTHVRSPRTLESVQSVPRGERIFFDTKINMGSVWYLRSQSDTSADLEQGVRFADLYEVIEYVPLEQPRWMQLSRNVHKVDPQTGSTIAQQFTQGRAIYFDTKVHHNGQWYLRTRFDTQRDQNNGIPQSAVRNMTPVYETLEQPRAMQVRPSGAHKINLITEENVGSVLEPGELFFMDTKINTGGTWYMRARSDRDANRDIAIRLADLEAAQIDYSPLDELRDLTAVRRTSKLNLITGETGPVLNAGRTVHFSTKVWIDDRWFLRSTYDTERENDWVVPFHDLR